MHHSPDKSKEKKLAHFKDICKHSKIKLTPQRLVIYNELIDSEEHPSTDMVYQQVKKQFPTISFDTVNRTLATFSEIGLASVVEGTGTPRRYDGNLSKHHHFQCLSCKKIFDVYDESYNTLDVPEELRNAHTILTVTVRLEGICEQCKG
ncbi:transcriptional repressor [candidate division KSB3 bacterium]|uniref:Transcriptional repressor n=1 Tax=candidate division KSB3 bacterium TaxID=2044937 RepID=A0A2G6E7J8_9BACT|nr:MAG: transcriptional repressor [candidate division KSB3 bacterium]PIE30289.1 MAG: transcriptional repressor [candidate division KSB3 bacterium]